MANQKSYNASDVENYVEKIVNRLFEARHWAAAEHLLKECPQEMRSDVAFLLLQHVVIEPYGRYRREDLH